MLLIKTIEKYYYDLLSKQLDVPIYNHAPENAKFPLIKIGRISTEPWLLTPESRILNVNFDVFSCASSNVESLEILEDLETIIFSKHTQANDLHISHQVLEHGEVFQQENNIWCAQLAIKVYAAFKH